MSHVAARGCLIASLTWAGAVSAQPASPSNCTQDAQGMVQPVDQAERADASAKIGHPEASKEASDPTLLAIQNAIESSVDSFAHPKMIKQKPQTTPSVLRQTSKPSKTWRNGLSCC